MNTETQLALKKEVLSMVDAGIFRPTTYTEWLSNIVPVRKKNGKIRVCVDYRDLNAASPKDVYPMPIADMLVDALAGQTYPRQHLGVQDSQAPLSTSACLLG